MDNCSYIMTSLMLTGALSTRYGVPPCASRVEELIIIVCGQPDGACIYCRQQKKLIQDGRGYIVSLLVDVG